MEILRNHQATEKILPVVFILASDKQEAESSRLHFIFKPLIYNRVKRALVRPYIFSVTASQPARSLKLFMFELPCNNTDYVDQQKALMSIW